MLFVPGIYLKIIIMARYLALLVKVLCNIAYKDFKMQKDKFLVHRRLSKLLLIFTIEGYLVTDYEVA